MRVGIRHPTRSAHEGWGPIRASRAATATTTDCIGRSLTAQGLSMLTKREFLSSAALTTAAVVTSCLPAWAQTTAGSSKVTPNEARAIAKEAYVWGYALVDDHRIQYPYFIDKSHPEYKADWNTIGH